MNFSGISNRTLVGRLLRQPLRLIPDQVAMPILQGRLRGMRWIAGSHTHGCWLGSYEIEKQGCFESAVLSGDTVFDIGANAGYYTLLASVLVGPTGRVYSFEPVPRNIRYLKEHLRINDICNATVFEAAVSDRDGVAYFDDSPGHAMGHLGQNGTLEVKTVRLDNLFSKGRIASPECLKIDVEGDELLVLLGAQLILEKARPKILLATHGQSVHKQCCEFLLSLHYNLQPIDCQSLEDTDEVLAMPK